MGRLLPVDFGGLSHVLLFLFTLFFLDSGKVLLSDMRQWIHLFGFQIMHVVLGRKQQKKISLTVSFEFWRFPSWLVIVHHEGEKALNGEPVKLVSSPGPDTTEPRLPQPGLQLWNGLGFWEILQFSFPRLPLFPPSLPHSLPLSFFPWSNVESAIKNTQCEIQDWDFFFKKIWWLFSH